MGAMTTKMTLSRRFLILFSAIGIVIFISLGLLIHQKLKREKLASIESSLNGQLKQVDFAINSFFANIDASVMILADNPLVRTLQDHDFTNFTTAAEHTFSYSIGPIEKRIRQLFASYKQRYPYVNSVYMGRENGGFARSHKRARPSRYDPRQREWYQLAKANPEKIMRTKPYRSVTTSDVNIGTTKALVDDRGLVFGVVGVDVTLVDLSKFVTEMELGYQGQVVLLDDIGEILATAWPHLKSKALTEVFPGLPETLSERPSGMIQTDQYIINYVTAGQLQWKILVITPVSVVEAEIWKFSVNVMALLLVFGAALGILVWIGLHRFVTRPISDLSLKTEEITMTGNLDTRVNVNSKDEIGVLGQSFNRMVIKLKDMERRIRRHSSELEETVRQRTAELAVSNEELQHELNLRREAERKLKLERTYLEQLFALSPEAIALIDDEDHVIRINAEFTRIFGYQPDEVIGKSLDESLIPPHLRDEGRMLKQRLVKGKRLWSETRRQHKDGSMIDVSVTGTAVELGNNHHGVYAIYRDIRERKRYEEELRRAKEEAESADRLKSAFLATMSHELRTPLNSIIGFTGILLQGLVGPLNDEQKKQLGMVKASARHLLDLINDVLDISKIEAGQLELSSEPFKIKAKVEKVLKLLTPLAGKKGLKLKVNFSEDVGEMIGDARRLEQIMVNLVNNAIKFTDEGRVEVNCTARHGKLRISVSDTGIGIEPDHISKLFQEFQQLDTGTTRKYDGTGLGLSICRKLVVLQGGRIWAESAGLRQGSTFSFWLPLNGEGENEV